jgi:hypothetical protein
MKSNLVAMFSKALGPQQNIGPTGANLDLNALHQAYQQNLAPHQQEAYAVQLAAGATGSDASHFAQMAQNYSAMPPLAPGAPVNIDQYYNPLIRPAPSQHVGPTDKNPADPLHTGSTFADGGDALIRQVQMLLAQRNA